MGLALLIEGLLLLMLLAIHSEKPPGTKESRLTVVNFKEAPAPSPEREQQAKKRPAPQRPAPKEPPPSQPTEPKPEQVVRPIPTPQEQPPPVPVNPMRATPPSRPVYGPPDTGGSSASRDSEQVGTAPNGEPLYAAAWYREPTDQELRGYLSTARGPGWGLIACRTAPEYRVEDCVGLDEYPEGSQITRAVLAAAWEFKVRPPRLGGRSLVGSWVRIRIDYIERRH
jgi:periplasmic protein TonB